MPLVVPYVKLPQLRTFPRPTGLRQMHNTQQMATRGERYVYSEAELRSAIGEVASRFSVDASGLPLSDGGSIVVAGSFSVSDTIIIPPRASFLTISSLGGSRILPSVPDQGTLFNVQGEFVTLRDLFVLYAASGGVPTAWFNTFVETEDPAGLTDGVNLSPDNCHVFNCTFFGDRLFVDGTAGNSDEAIISGNYVVEANATHAACVVLDSPRMICRDNTTPDGGGDSITVSTNGEHCRIIGNDCANGDITTSASTGSNVIMGNVRVGTITRHVTDAEGLNT